MIDYNEDWLISLVFRWHGSIYYRAFIFAFPCTCLSFAFAWLDRTYDLSLRELLGLEVSNNSGVLWSCTTGVLTFMLIFRTNRAMARFWEGTSLLHQMRGEWFDSISCCVTFSVGAAKERREAVLKFRHTLIRLMSLCHGSALGEIAGDRDGSDLVECIDTPGLDNRTLQHLTDCEYVHQFNRVEVLLHLIRSLITNGYETGILKIPPPILSRVYQTLSRGFVNLLNAKKIADTRFPFPYAQIITLLLFFHTVMTPMFMSCLVPSLVWCPIFTFVPIFSFFAINFIGVELENPFGKDDNDLPLDRFQTEMNKCLMMLLHDGADLIAGVSPTRCILEYGELRSTLVNGLLAEDAGIAQELEANITNSEVTRAQFLEARKHSRTSNMSAEFDLKAGAEELDREDTGDSALMTRADHSKMTESPRPRRTSQYFRRQSTAVPYISPTQVFEEVMAQVNEPKDLDSQMFDRVESTPSMNSLREVDVQVRELSGSIKTLTDFISALPGIADAALRSNRMASAQEPVVAPAPDNPLRNRERSPRSGDTPNDIYI